MRGLLGACLILGALACGPTRPNKDPGGDGGNTDPDGDTNTCPSRCSADLHDVLDCHGNVLTSCTGTEACDPASFACTNACVAAERDNRSIGCDYYATAMHTTQPNYCFAMFVANTWSAPAHINVQYRGADLQVASFARIPVGAGPNLSMTPYDPVAGIPPGEVAILFLAGGTGAAPLCPTATAVPGAPLAGTGISDSFHVTTDVPVVAYQINPYGGGTVAVTAASLLLPSSVWDTDYVAVNVSELSVGAPSLNIVAREDGTVATITPVAAVTAGGAIPASPAGVPFNINLNKGQHAQITQNAELTGSVVTANKPIGFMAGQTCMRMPTNTPYCDHGEQMIPPVRALGSRYVGVMYRPRRPAETSTFWRIVGAVDGTQLTYSTDVGGPPKIDKGQALTFQTGTPFVVSSQDRDHPFMLFTYMTSSEFVQSGYGDPDFVVSVPPEQYLSQYVFFADPTYPETNLVIVRSRASDGTFKDVHLDCVSTPLQGWQPIGSDFEYTRADLVTGNFMGVGACSTGRHEIKSAAPFGLWVWGWGTPGTNPNTQNVSYGYPGGMNVAPINDVIL